MLAGSWLLVLRKDEVQVKRWRQWCRRGCIALVIATGWTALPASAHTASWSVKPDARPLTIKFAYTDGEPMAFAKVKVLAPDQQVFQIGNADRQGQFAFVPASGASDALWTLVASGDEGHEINAVVSVAELSSIARRRSIMSSSLAWLLVASVLGNIAFVCAQLERRARVKRRAKNGSQRLRTASTTPQSTPVPESMPPGPAALRRGAGNKKGKLV